MTSSDTVADVARYRKFLNSLDSYNRETTNGSQLMSGIKTQALDLKRNVNALADLVSQDPKFPNDVSVIHIVGHLKNLIESTRTNKDPKALQFILSSDPWEKVKENISELISLYDGLITIESKIYEALIFLDQKDDIDLKSLEREKEMADQTRFVRRELEKEEIKEIEANAKKYINDKHDILSTLRGVSAASFKREMDDNKGTLDALRVVISLMNSTETEKNQTNLPNLGKEVLPREEKRERNRETTATTLKDLIEESLMKILQTPALYIQGIYGFINNLTVSVSGLISTYDKGKTLRREINTALKILLDYDHIISPLLRDRTARFVLGIGEKIDEETKFLKYAEIIKDVQKIADKTSILKIEVNFDLSADPDEKIKEVWGYFESFASNFMKFMQYYSTFTPPPRPNIKETEFSEDPILNKAIDEFRREINKQMEVIRGLFDKLDGKPNPLDIKGFDEL